MGSGGKGSEWWRTPVKCYISAVRYKEHAVRRREMRGALHQWQVLSFLTARAHQTFDIKISKIQLSLDLQNFFFTRSLNIYVKESEGDRALCLFDCLILYILFVPVHLIYNNESRKKQRAPLQNEDKMKWEGRAKNDVEAGRRNQRWAWRQKKKRKRKEINLCILVQAASSSTQLSVFAVLDAL